ncbi:LacI family DNA-binding transcriptional regulator [Garciella nitratireducens]|uniref:LacI family DNA-binding transcriptional regulator n=1 Tax=Garciella nitratireducens TaxID=218205 RepID=UPI001BD1D3BD|nr:LacI family DNA-binding transcriptional regulator [Garciella nitratireducens]
MLKKSVTIKEIAKEAQVSIATVSMILNNKDKNISESTRNKVLKIAKEKNYIPNTMARSLITKQTGIIGLVIPDITNPFFPEIARGVEDKASEERYSIIICNTDDNLQKEDQYIQILTEKMVDGIVITHSADRYQEDSIRILDGCRVPIVLIDRDYSIPNVIGKVLVDNFKASYEAVNYLLNKGYRKIAYITGSLNTKTARDRLEGYKEALLTRGISYDERYIKVGEYKIQWGIDATKKLVSEDVFFDAIFCGNDLIAIGSMKALKKFRLKVPQDIGIMGFDDIYMASVIEPSLTTMKQPNYEMGYYAAELLIEGIKKESLSINEKNTKKIILDSKLIVRESS